MQDGAIIHGSAGSSMRATAATPIQGWPWWKMCASILASSCGGVVFRVGELLRQTVRPILRRTASSDDIRARPLYADSQGADIYIAHHTNAGGGGTATGTETFRDTAMEHSDMGERQLQSRKRRAEQRDHRTIRTHLPRGEPSWSNRGVKDSAGGFGEIRIPNRPAILIELAFHDDCSRDAPVSQGRLLPLGGRVGHLQRNMQLFRQYADVGQVLRRVRVRHHSNCDACWTETRNVSVRCETGACAGSVIERLPSWAPSETATHLRASTRVNISGEVKPGSTYTFNFTLTAPGTTGGLHDRLAHGARRLFLVRRDDQQDHQRRAKR